MYSGYLIDCGHNSMHVHRVFEQVGVMTQDEARKRKHKKEGNNHCCTFVTKFNSRTSIVLSILRKHRTIVDNDEVAGVILPEKSIRVSYHRGANLKELLAPFNPYKKIEPSSRSCFKCTARRCDRCKNFLISGSSFSSTATGRSFNICKAVTCTSQNVIYSLCDL